ncbi:MAG: hypothetical protein JNL01_06155 [Bdellovibrionales bacterium]|nr:hypothetical protein [Bdellovibrionales bacterium]
MSKRLSLLTLGTVVLALGCQPKRAAFFPSWFGTMGRTDSVSVGRRPAQAPAPVVLGTFRNGIQCKGSGETSDEIRRYIANQEKTLGSARFKAEFNGTTFESLTLGEWDYLEHVKRVNRDRVREMKWSTERTSWLIDPSIQVQGCSGLPCVINRAYKKADDDPAGYHHYAFFLKTGYILNASDQILDYTEADFPDYKTGKPSATALKREDFFFSSSELQAFQRLAQSLPTELKNLPSLVPIYRVPKTRAIPKVPAPACGVSRGNWRIYTYTDTGRVVVRMIPLDVYFTDKCLAIGSTPQDPYQGFFYEAATHELGHHLDFSSREPLNQQFSESDVWINESSWIVEKGTRKNSEGKDEFYEDWKHGEQAAFVSDYAKDSPVEDFAESVAHFRIRPAELEKKAPNKLKILQERVFGKRSYTQAGVLEQYADRAVQAVRQEFPEILSVCGSGSDPSESDRAYLPLPANWGEPVQTCIQGRVQKAFIATLQEISASAADSCQFLASKENIGLLESLFVERIEEAFAWLPDQVSLTPDDLGRRIAQFRDQIAQGTDPREIAFDCRTDPSPMNCYQKTLDVGFDQVASKSSVVLDRTILEAEKAVQRNRKPYPLAKSEVNAYFRWILLGSGRLIEKAAANRIAPCVSKWIAKGKPRTLTSETGRSWLVHPYSGKMLNIPGMVLECINRDFDQEISRVFDNWASQRKDLGVPTEGEIRKEAEFLLKRDYLDSIDARIQEGDATALQAWTKLEEPVKKELLASLTKNSSWVPSKLGSDALSRECFKAAAPLFEKATTSAPVPLTYSLADYRSKWVGEVCAQVSSSPAIAALQTENAWQVALKDSERLAKFYLDDSWNSCKKMHRTSKNKRTTCFQIGWDGAISRAVRFWTTSDLGKPFAQRVQSVKDYLKRPEVVKRLKSAYEL